jgi:hypothetical protein
VGNQYLVVWSAPETVAGFLNYGYEIYAQRLAGSGAEVGANDFRISDVGGLNETTGAAESPRVAFDPVNRQFLVTFRADDNVGGQVDGELEIFGQRYTLALAPLVVSGFEPGNFSEWSAHFPRGGAPEMLPEPGKRRGRRGPESSCGVRPSAGTTSGGDGPWRTLSCVRTRASSAARCPCSLCWRPPPPARPC